MIVKHGFEISEDAIEGGGYYIQNITPGEMLHNR